MTLTLETVETYNGMARTTPKTVVAMFVIVTLVICINYTHDNKTVDHETKSLDISATSDKVQHLVSQLTRLVGREGLLKIAQNQTKENCGHENLTNMNQTESLTPETNQNQDAPPVLRHLREKGVSCGLANKDISQMSKQEITLSMHSTLDQTSTVCHRKLRMGSIGDGGWEICDDADVRPRQPCIIYSFGINNDWSFDDMSSQTYGCHVYSFDPSIKQETYNRSSHVHFYKVGLSDKTTQIKSRGWQMYTFKDIRKMLGHETTPIDIVKVDIEAYEWMSVKQMFEDGQTDTIKQFLLEFHIKWVTADKLRLIQKLEQSGFKSFYVHKNADCKHKVDGFPGSVTHCYEVHYVKRP